MGAIKNLKKSIQRWRNISFNKIVGYYQVTPDFSPAPLFFKHPKHPQSTKDLWWLVKHLYFAHYCPTGDDVVVDLGAGYGEEVLYWLKWRCELDQKKFEMGSWPGSGRYISVEIQPSIYECLCLNIAPWKLKNSNVGAQTWPLYLGNEKEIFLPATASYFSIGQESEGIVRVPGQSWSAFCQEQGITQVDLLKMNIEGGELPFLKSLNNSDWSKIRRLIISCHDFRANNNEGEFYRTKQEVIKILTAQKYQIKNFTHGINWADDWIFASRL